MYRIGLLLCSVFVLNQGHSLRKRENGRGLETVIDELIYEYTQNTEEVALQDIHLDWNYAQFFRGEFIGKGGWVKNVTTLKRRGDLELEEGDDSLTLGISLGLDKFSFGFHEFKVSFFPLLMYGKLNISVGENEVYGKITFKMEETLCETTLEDFKLTKFGKFGVQISGLGLTVSDWLWSSLAQNIANQKQRAIANFLSNYMKNVTAQALKENDICEKLLFY